MEKLSCRHFTGGEMKSGSLGELKKPICPKIIGFLGDLRKRGETNRKECGEPGGPQPGAA
jgi:hypothetical protein